jgi:glycosyltransferase involved in cell wall biosynthesis
VYPSVYEGFGLPPLEAARCGCPVVATRVGALAEVLGDAAVLVPPGDADALASALAELFADHDRRAELAQRAEERVARLSWESTALWTLAAYREVGVDLLGGRVPPEL